MSLWPRQAAVTASLASASARRVATNRRMGMSDCAYLAEGRWLAGRGRGPPAHFVRGAKPLRVARQGSEKSVSLAGDVVCVAEFADEPAVLRDGGDVEPGDFTARFAHRPLELLVFLQVAGPVPSVLPCPPRRELLSWLVTSASLALRDGEPRQNSRRLRSTQASEMGAWPSCGRPSPRCARAAAAAAVRLHSAVPKD